MRDTAYDLFKGTPQENALWLETLEGLRPAIDRMNRLALTKPDDYFLFHTGGVVASVKNPSTHRQQTPLAWRIVVVSSDRSQLCTLREILKRQDLEPICASMVSQCRAVLSKEQIGLVFCDRNLSDGDHKDVIEAARSTGSKARIVVTSRQAGWHEFLEAMRLGAFDVISTPCQPEDVEWMIIQAKRDDRKMGKQLLTSDADRFARSADGST